MDQRINFGIGTVRASAGPEAVSVGNRGNSRPRPFLTHWSTNIYPWHWHKGGLGNNTSCATNIIKKWSIWRPRPLCASAKDIYWLTIGLGGSRPTITSVSDRDGLWPCTGSDCTYPKIYFLQTFYLPTRFAILGPPTLSKMY